MRLILVLGVLALMPLAGFAQTLTPSQDAYYVPGNGTNYGAAASITVGSSSSIGLVQFDLSTLPAGVTASQVQKATLTLFLNRANVGGAVDINTVASSWSELTVNGNSPPSSGSLVATGVAATSANTFLTVDATAAVQGWITSPVANNGFMIAATPLTSPIVQIDGKTTPLTSASVQFDSKENQNTSHPATLSIVLAAAGPAGAPGANGHSLLNGSAPPAAGAGADGDFYLLKPSMCLYGPKAAGTWPTPCSSLIGPAGASTHIESGSGSCTGATNTQVRCPTHGVVFSTRYATTPVCMIGLSRANFSLPEGHVDISINSLFENGFEGALQVLDSSGGLVTGEYSWACWPR